MFVKLQQKKTSRHYHTDDTDSCKYSFLCVCMCLYTKKDNTVVSPVISLCFNVKRKRRKCKQWKEKRLISSKAINIILDSVQFFSVTSFLWLVWQRTNRRNTIKYYLFIGDCKNICALLSVLVWWKELMFPNWNYKKLEFPRNSSMFS